MPEKPAPHQTDDGHQTGKTGKTGGASSLAHQGQGMVRDERGQEQPADKERAQLVSHGKRSTEPRR